MNTPQLGLRVASVFFGLVGVGHLIRAATSLRITVGELTIPVSVSAIAFVVCGAMAFWLWNLSLHGQGEHVEHPDHAPPHPS